MKTPNMPAVIGRSRQLSLMRQTLELLRNEVQTRRLSSGEKEFSDWKDADDWLFSVLNLTSGDLDAIYGGQTSHGRVLLPYVGSAIEGTAPAGFSYEELKEFVGVELGCEERKFNWAGAYVAAYAKVPGHPVLFTDGDVPALVDETGSTLRLIFTDSMDGSKTEKDISLLSSRRGIIACISCG